MTIINSLHLLEQAETLIASRSVGALRQVDIRRAISAAYYGVFHMLATAAADEFVGVTKRSSNQYGLVYRSLDHAWLRSLSKEVQKQVPTARFRRHLPLGGFGSEIVRFAATTAELQERREAADYDPMIRVSVTDALVAVETARSALKDFASAAAEQRGAFLTLLQFPPRR